MRIVTLNYSCNSNSGNVLADFYVINDDNNTVNGIYSQGSSSCSAGNTFSSSPIYQICNITAQPFFYYYDTIYSGRKPTMTYGVNPKKANTANDCGIGNGGSNNKSQLVDYDESVTRCEKIKAALEAETNPEVIEVLEAELAQAESRRLSIIGNAVRGILTDSVSDINETRQWLYRAHTPSADRAICATYLSQGDYETAISKATSMIDKYEMEDDALIEQTEYISILRLQQKVESDGRVMQSLNADELKQVQRLADNGTGVARSIANALLQMNGLAIAECDCANGIAPTRNTETIADGVIESSEADSYLFAISPVPAKDYIIIDYNLPTDHATLTITNNLGVTVKKIAINSKSGKKVLPLPEIKAGVYSCTMSCEGFVETQKIVLTK